MLIFAACGLMQAFSLSLHTPGTKRASHRDQNMALRFHRAKVRLTDKGGKSGSDGAQIDQQLVEQLDCGYRSGKRHQPLKHMLIDRTFLGGGAYHARIKQPPKRLAMQRCI
ncbi:MAG: hypothetical protein ACRC6I_09785 [Paracoccaceae bacterium]